MNLLLIIVPLFVKGHAGKINALLFVPESQNIVSCASDKILNVIDVRTGTQIFFTTIEDEPTCLTWQGPYLLAGDARGNVNVWDFQAVVLVSKIRCHDGKIFIPNNN